MNKVIITGGPHTGKTTLLNALKKKHPEYTFVSEPATLVIEEEHRREETILNYEGVFPWNNYAGFGPNVIAKSLELEGRVVSDSGLIVLDRSLIDTVAYARLNDCEHLLPELYGHIKNAGYGQAFFCDFIGSYEKNEIRSESFKEAQKTQEALSVAYSESGIKIINMPVASIEERVKIFENVCGISNR